MKKVRLAVLISGNGTNLQAIIDACENNFLPATVELVISNNKDAYGLERARNSAIDCEVIDHRKFSGREDFDREINSVLEKKEIEFVCLAGFMRLLTGFFVDKWEKRIVNIHPSLLPSFKGVNAQKQALDYGVKITGCTVHFVNKDMDGGSVIMQKAVEIHDGDDEKSLSERILEQENKCYTEALRIILNKYLK